MNLKPGTQIEVTITDLAFGGKGVAKLKLENGDFTIFVDGGYPGETALIEIQKKKRRHAEAKVIETITPSPHLEEHDFQLTPGAPWLGLPIAIQQQYKKAQVKALFQKFAQTNIDEVITGYLTAEPTEFYRNKMDYSFGPTEESYAEVPGNRGEGDTYKQWSHTGFGLGSKKRGQFWLVENLVKPSGLFDPDFEAQLKPFRDLAERLEPTVYNSKTNLGFWRQLVVKKSFHEDKFLLNLITNIAPKGFKITPVIEFWQQALGERLKGFYWTQSDNAGDAGSKYQTRELVFGGPTIIECMNVLEFEISIDSFFQTNIFSADKLYAKVGELVPSTSNILELFAGTGTISQILARKYPEADITSVEIVESAVNDAKANAKRNSLAGINFVCADVNQFMKSYEGQPPVVVLDPPRAGISPKPLQKIIDFEPQEIIYVSCNAATLARDTNTLQKNNFNLNSLTLIDQFPHTAHVECLARFVRS